MSASTHTNSIFYYTGEEQTSDEHPYTTDYRRSLREGLLMLRQWEEIDRTGYLASHVGDHVRSIYGVTAPICSNGGRNQQQGGGGATSGADRGGAGNNEEE